MVEIIGVKFEFGVDFFGSEVVVLGEFIEYLGFIEGKWGFVEVLIEYVEFVGIEVIEGLNC